MNELSEKLNAPTSTMTRIVNNLVRESYVARSRDESDRRIAAYLPRGQVEEVLKAAALLVEAFNQANPNCC